MDKKEIIKTIILIIVIIGIVVYAIITYKSQVNDFVYYNEIVDENVIDEVITEDIKDGEVSKIKVYITGEINNPGVKELEEGSRIEDIINASGGLTVNADISGVNLAYCLEDGQKVYIPNINDEIKNEIVSEENNDRIIENMNEKISEKVNLNQASIEELCELPGVGESLAQRIINYREENGKFKKIEDLKNVSGFGDKKYESLKEYIIIK